MNTVRVTRVQQQLQLKSFRCSIRTAGTLQSFLEHLPRRTVQPGMAAARLNIPEGICESSTEALGPTQHRVRSMQQCTKLGQA